METILPKDEKIAAVIKFDDSRENFQSFVEKFMNMDFNVSSEKYPELTEHLKGTTSIYILGTVNGVVRNEILFVKD